MFSNEPEFLTVIITYGIIPGTVTHCVTSSLPGQLAPNQSTKIALVEHVSIKDFKLLYVVVMSNVMQQKPQNRSNIQSKGIDVHPTFTSCKVGIDLLAILAMLFSFTLRESIHLTIFAALSF